MSISRAVSVRFNVVSLRAPRPAFVVVGRHPEPCVAGVHSQSVSRTYGEAERNVNYFFRTPLGD